MEDTTFGHKVQPTLKRKDTNALFLKTERTLIWIYNFSNKLKDPMYIFWYPGWFKIKQFAVIIFLL